MIPGKSKILRAALSMCVVGWVAASAADAASPQKSNRRTLTVFAASSLTDAFKRIGKKFEAAHPGVAVRFNFGASNLLAVQINESAPADVFASASETLMAKADADGELDSAPVALGRNRLTAVVPRDNPAGIRIFADLAKPGVKLVLAAPGVPAGDFARESLKKAGLLDAALKNLVSNEENVRGALAKVVLGEADASIVYVSDAAARPGVKSIEIPEDQNVVAVYPIAVLRSSAEPELARAFVEFATGAASQALLKSNGFLPAKGLPGE